MTYVRRTLSRNERELYQANYHWLYWFAGVLLTLAPALTLAVVAFGNWAMLATLALTAIAVPFGLAILIGAYATEIVVTTDRFVKKSGLISFAAEDMSLDKVEEIELHESILGALFDYGTVEVRGTGTSSIRVDMVQSPERLRHEIDAAREALRLPQAA
jgi:hypothetical protein